MIAAPETPPAGGWAVLAADGEPVDRRGDLTAAEAAALAASAPPELRARPVRLIPAGSPEWHALRCGVGKGAGTTTNAGVSP